MRVRNLLVFFLLTGLMMSCGKSGHKFVIIGNINGMPEGNVVLEQLSANDVITVLDSVRSNKDGHFEFTQASAEPGLYRLHFRFHRFILLSLENENVKVIADWNNIEKYNITGSVASENLRQLIGSYRDQMRDFHTMNMVLDTLKARGSDSMLAAARKDVADMNSKFTRFIEHYADTTHYLPNAVFAARMLNPGAEVSFLDQFAQGLGKRFPNTKMQKEFTEYYLKISNRPSAVAKQDVLVGEMAPDVKLPSLDNKMISLSDFRGKYVLLDFWASFCPPCREENPNLVRCYKKYKDKGFEIFGVSLDDNKVDWDKAMKDDHITWPQVCDLKRWECPVAKRFGIDAIPANFLIDPYGKVIARNLQGDKLDEMLANTLK
jgi:peroxiredoxin